MPDPQRLDELRAEIDRLDTLLHDTLMQRADVVAEVARTKAASSGAIGTALRPDREAAMAKRFAKRHHGPFPIRSLQRIWREIVNATTQEVQMRFAVHLGTMDAKARDAARYTFGDASELVVHDSARAALDAAGGNESDIAALPVGDGPWWRDLAERAGVIMRIGDLLVVGPSLALDWDVDLIVTSGDQEGFTTLASAPDGSRLISGDIAALDPSAVIRHIGGYMDAPWVGLT